LVSSKVKEVKAEIITIGDEILIGQIVDTNSAWIGQTFNLEGIEISRINSITDTAEAIIGALEGLLPSTELVIMTGGLGPTKDDLTKQTLARYFGANMVFRDDVWAHIVKLFESFGRKPVERNKFQAEVPDNCEVLFNHKGTAPGMLFRHNGRRIVSLPGVPYEMKGIIKDELLPLLQDEIDYQIKHKTLFVVGVPESVLADQIEPYEGNFPENIKLAYLPKPGLVRLRLTARGKRADDLNSDLELAAKVLKQAVGDPLMDGSNSAIEKYLGKVLTQKGLTVGTAESCTGGGIGATLVSVAGSSAYFEGSIVAYSYDIKETLLGVDHTTIVEKGAVSEEVVRQMSEGARVKLKVDFAVAVSGIAGPEGGTQDKPVGTSWIAIAGPNRTITEKFVFGKVRERNIQKTIFAALNLLLKEVEDYG
jgi:nicotinamide-nucleotide amidase